MSSRIKYWQLLDDNFLRICKQSIFLKELCTKYEGKMEHISTLGYEVDIVECEEDQETLSLLHNGILPVQFGRLDRLERVWRFQACFRADPKLETELLIGQLRGLVDIWPLDLHNGKEWVYEPMSRIK